MRDFSAVPDVEVFTLHDLVHRLSLRTESDVTTKNIALWTRAIQDAIRGLPGKHDWNYFIRHARFQTTARITPTCTYDHTGGASERLLTITDGTNIWPADAELGEVWIDDIEKPFRVYQRLSDTQVTLEPNFSFSEDFTATEVNWGRKAYQFNREITRVHQVQNLSQDRPIAFLPTVDFQDATHAHWGYGVTELCTWQNHGTKFGAADFILIPHPTEVNDIEVTATVNPIIPRIHLESGGDATIAAGSNQVTCTGAAFTNKLVGSIIRIGRRTDIPSYFDNRDFEFQAFVMSVDSTTQLTLSETAPSALATRGWTISSPADLEASTMIEYVEDEAFHQYCKNHKHETFREARAVAKESLRAAIARDNKTSLNSQMWAPYNSSTWWLSGGFYNVVSPTN